MGSVCKIYAKYEYKIQILKYKRLKSTGPALRGLLRKFYARYKKQSLLMGLLGLATYAIPSFFIKSTCLLPDCGLYVGP